MIGVTGIAADSSVREAIHQGHWRISPRSRSPVLSFLREVLPDPSPIFLSQAPDSYIWLPPEEDGDSDRPRPFSASRTYAALSHPSPEVPWHSMIWFTGRIPKHAFIVWIAAHDRLATRDRIHRFSPTTPVSCLLCSSQDESRDHLFFLCSYSYSLLHSVLCMITAHTSFFSVLQWLPRSSSKEQLRLIAHLLIQATVYHLWRERNARLHTGSAKPYQQLAKEIRTDVKARLISLIRPSDQDTSSILEFWFGHQAADPLFSLTP